MKNIKAHWLLVVSLATAGAISILPTLDVHADAPILAISRTGTNVVAVTVINGATDGTYEIYYTELLEAQDWQIAATGNPGETNFLFDISDTLSGFFRAINGNDLDGDGIPNFKDARPNDPLIGVMTVTIETPVNGSNVQ